MMIGVTVVNADLSTVRGVKDNYINIVHCGMNYIPSIEEYEAGGNTYPDSVLRKIAEIEAKEAGNEAESSAT